MSDLISRKAVTTEIHNYFKGLIDKGIHNVDVVDCNAEICKEVVDNIPVAYDVDKVVEQLEAERYIVGVNASINDDTTADYIKGFNDMVNRSLDIAKGAVKDE